MKVKRSDFTKVVEVDECPDISFLGEYADAPAPWNICRHCGEYVALIEGEHNCPHYSREFNFVKPYAVGEKEGTDTYIKYGRQDFERLEAMQRGEWQFLGVMARVTVRIPMRDGAYISHTVESPGIWGIESDCQESIDEAFEGEKATLETMLVALGIEVED